MNNKVKLLIVKALFIFLVGYNIYLLFYPYQVSNSIALGRFWISCWIILEGAVLIGLVTYASWTLKALWTSYCLSIVSAIFCGKIAGMIFLIFFWTIIYIPVIKYLKKPEIRSLFKGFKRADMQRP